MEFSLSLDFVVQDSCCDNAQVDNNTTTMEEAHIDLEPGSEWRFELEADENVAVRVSAGPPAVHRQLN